MTNADRRNMLRTGLVLAAVPSTILHSGCAHAHGGASAGTDSQDARERSLKIHYLEIVTPEVDELCETYSSLLGVAFGERVPILGQARTARLATGGMLGIRAPLRDTELPIVRHYILVEDIEAAVDMAAEAGLEVAYPPTKTADEGMAAIVIQGGIEFGFWQL